MIRRLGIWMGAGLLTLAAATGWAEEQKPLSDQKAKESYVLGYEFGGNIKRQKVDIDLEVLVNGIKEGLAGSASALPQEEVKKTVQHLRQRLIVAQNALREEAKTKNRAAGEAFLAANKTKDGVVTLASGLQYKVLKEGDGAKPAAGDRIKVNYRGRLIDGNEFDSSYSRGEPTVLSMGGMIRGWTEALPMMKAGSKWELFVPSDLAYGERGNGAIPPNAALIFEVELLSVVKQEPAALPAEAALKAAAQ